MKKRHLLVPLAAGAILASCDSGKTTESGGEEPGTPAAAQAPAAAEPAAPSAPGVAAALEAQPIGGKLLGNTVKLVGDKYQPADLDRAPEYYLVYYSASW